MENLVNETFWTAITVYRPSGADDCALIRRSTHQSPRFYPRISKATRNRLIYLYACGGNRVMCIPYPPSEGQLSFYWNRRAGGVELRRGEMNQEIPNNFEIREKTRLYPPVNLLLSWVKTLSGRS